jgi:RNA polymerase sigma-70 factor, ECF subfamily
MPMDTATEDFVLTRADSELLALMRAGQSSAYAALMRGNNQRLYRLARGVLGDDAEAEEAVQEGYLRAFMQLDGFKGRASLATWLSRIVLNEALARLRRRRPTVDIDDMRDTLAAGDDAATTARREASPEQAIAQREIRRAIETAIDELPPSFRAVFILRAIEQMSVEETATCLDIMSETVKTRFHRANKLLRQSLTAEFGAIFEGAFPFLGKRCDRLIAGTLRRLGLPNEINATTPLRDRPAPSRSPP